MLNRDLVLIVDDEFIITETLRIYVEDMGLKVCGVAGVADDAVALAEAERPFTILMDVRLIGERDGVDAAKEIHERVGSRVIYITGSREPATMTRINSDHPAAILFKPVSQAMVTSTIQKVLAE